MNQITYDGKPVNIGPTPEIIKECGFCDPDEVTLAANRMSHREARMQLADVVDWFCDHYSQHEVEVEVCS